MPLKNNIFQIINYFVLSAPIFISSTAVLDSFFNQNMKGIVFLFGALVTMFLGNMLAPTFGRKVPNITRGDRVTFNSACNLMDKSSDGWGTEWSSPAPHVLYLAFTISYLILSMISGNGIQIGIIILLGIVFLWSIGLRTAGLGLPIQSLNCVKKLDVVIGIILGLFFGLIWFASIWAIQNSNDPPYDMLYFNNGGSGPNRCSLKNQTFKCTPRSK